MAKDDATVKIKCCCLSC